MVPDRIKLQAGASGEKNCPALPVPPAPHTTRTHSPGVSPPGQPWPEETSLPSHSPDCRMTPLSVSLASSFASMVGFWGREACLPSQPGPGWAGGLEFPQLGRGRSRSYESALSAPGRAEGSDLRAPAASVLDSPRAQGGGQRWWPQEPLTLGSRSAGKRAKKDGTAWGREGSRRG